MRRCLFWKVMAGIAAGLSSTSAAAGGGNDLAAWWSFDATERNTTIDRAGTRTDNIEGNHRLVAGVAGHGLRFDGFTARITRKAEQTPRLGDAFTIEAWIAVQAYPWGWCPIVARRDKRLAGFFFGVDARGRLGMRAATSSGWQECNSERTVPLMKWTHVAGALDSAGITLYIDGKRAGHLATAGSVLEAKTSPLVIGRNVEKEPVQFSAAWGSPDQPMHFAFDGIIDELKIHRRALTDADMKQAIATTRPVAAPDMTPRQLPSGPEEARRFGAFYRSLKYCPEWDAVWRGGEPDVVVAFDFAPIRLVFWRGVSYAPCWVTENGNWFCNEFMERGADRKTRGCSESMSDKRAHYSHAKILESTDARAVVYWRNAPVAVNYDLAFVDPVSGWGDWSEEYHTVYPDGVAVRRVVMWSGNFKDWHEWCQSIEVLQPGQRPEDVLDEQRILSVANMKGQTKTFGWEPGAKSNTLATLPGANIQVTHLKSRFQPFLVLDDREGRNDRGRSGPEIARTGGDGWSERSRFPWCDHWPVTQIPVLERQAQFADRPSHTWTSTQYSAACETTDKSMTKVMLCGLTEAPIEEMLPLARSWLRPARLSTESDGFASPGYDPVQRAYVIINGQTDRPSTLRLTLHGSVESPIVNPAVVVRGWGERAAQLSIDGESIPRGRRYRCGQLRSMESTDLVVWIEHKAAKPMAVTLTPAPD